MVLLFESINWQFKIWILYFYMLKEKFNLHFRISIFLSLKTKNNLMRFSSFFFLFWSLVLKNWKNIKFKRKFFFWPKIHVLRGQKQKREYFVVWKFCFTLRKINLPLHVLQTWAPMHISLSHCRWLKFKSFVHKHKRYKSSICGLRDIESLYSRGTLKWLYIQIILYCIIVY